MTIDTWSLDVANLFTTADYGFMANLIPLVLVIGISWFLSKKLRESLYIQFPLCLALKVIFPFFHTTFLMLSFSVFVLALLGAKGDAMGDIKDVARNVGENIRDRVRLKNEFGKGAYSALKQEIEKTTEKTKADSLIRRLGGK